jgi:3-oxoacyl-[acyl-carrier protein] reductase
MELGLENRHIVIIGGTKGIGFAISKGFILEGAIVHIISRNYSPAVEQQFSDNLKVYFYQADALNLFELNDISKVILNRANNKIDVLVSNVGSGIGVMDAVPDELNWNQSWDINFNSALNSVRAFSEHINNGSILFISSIAGMEFIGAPVSYSTAKSALISFSKSLAHKLAPGIRVNTISPGNIFFEGGTWELKFKSDPKKVKDIISEKVPVKRFGLPEEVANLAVFISSDKASFITGACYVIDGGQTISY